jgi:glycosyltransferase involved in cell wall biosynthesis
MEDKLLVTVAPRLPAAHSLMGPRFSIVYPTRHRPAFVGQALRILEAQGYDDFQVVVSDNYLDPALSCEEICRNTSLANVTYVRPPRPVGMVENWNHSLQFATGDYLLYLTDKMFVLPGALNGLARAIDVAAGPDIVNWTSDAYHPASFEDYLGRGVYVPVPPAVSSGRFRQYSPAAELDRRGRATVARGEQSSADYGRGKLVFGAYRRDLVDRVIRRFGALFHAINPDYTSMILGLTEARRAIELGMSCVVSLNTDISNGQLSDTDDAAARRFLESLAGGTERILPSLLVPGLYVSQHNWVARS